MKYNKFTFLLLLCFLNTACSSFISNKNMILHSDKEHSYQKNIKATVEKAKLYKTPTSNSLNSVTYLKINGENIVNWDPLSCIYFEGLVKIDLTAMPGTLFKSFSKQNYQNLQWLELNKVNYMNAKVGYEKEHYDNKSSIRSLKSSAYIALYPNKEITNNYDREKSRDINYDQIYRIYMKNNFKDPILFLTKNREAEKLKNYLYSIYSYSSCEKDKEFIILQKNIRAYIEFMIKFSDN